MKKLLPAFALAALLLPACEKDNVGPDGLVKATQEGKNTGDFLVDGVAFSPRARISRPGGPSVGAYWDHFKPGDSNFDVSFFRQDDDKRERYLNLKIARVHHPGVYEMAENVNPFVVAGTSSYIVYTVPYTAPIYQPKYVTSKISPGRVIVTRFDTVARVISGTFEARLQEYNGPDSVRITKGRFDLKF